MKLRRAAFLLSWTIQIPLFAAGPVPADMPVPLSGDARGFGGGDPLDPRLHGVRADLERALGLIREVRALETLCAVGVCPAELAPAQCETVRRLDPAQVGECRSFLKLMADQFQKKKPLFSYEITDRAFTVADGTNGQRPVAAQTKIGAQGPIRFHRAGIESLSRDELTALIAHELGHKTSRKGFLDDTQPIAGFGTGRDFLDATGVALALFAAKHRIPAQAPPELAASIAPAFCSAAASTSPFRAGLSADVLGKLDKTPKGKETSDADRLETARRLLASPEARSHRLEGWFRKFLARPPTEDESMALVLQLSHGANSPALVAAFLKNEEYTNSRRLADDAAFVTAIHRDVLGRGPTADEVKTQVKQLAAVGKSDFLIQWLQQNETVLTELSRGWYSQWLNRLPWEAESRRHTAQLKTGMDWEEVQANLLASPEYAALQKVRAGACPSRGLSSK